MNKLRGTLNVCAVKAPGFGDRRKDNLGDLAAVTGGTLISEEIGRKLDADGARQTWAAPARSSSRKEETTIVQGAGSAKAVQGRVGAVKAAIDAATSDWDKEKLQERLGKLTGSVAVDQGRRRHRDRAEGAQAPRRGRRAGDPRSRRRGHRLRRWRRVHQRASARSTS